MYLTVPLPFLCLLGKGRMMRKDIDGNPEGIILRAALPSDASALLSIYAPYVRETAVSFEYEPPSVNEFRERIERISSRYPYIAAERDGRILGYAYAGPFKSRAAYNWDVETTIYIERGERRTGIGRILLLKLEEILSAMNVTNANACITYSETEDEYLTHDSIKFHSHMGYSMVGCFHKCGYKFNRWYDMVWMEKHLAEHRDIQSPVIPFPLVRDRFFP